MSQDVRVDLPTSLGYLLKEASAALRVSMEAVLRPLGMSVTHYACLELLAQRPGLSNSELARGTFVTRQSMNVLLQALEEDGIVTRPAQPASGRVLPTALTARGRRQLKAASAAVRAVELQMIAGLTLDEQDHLRTLLSQCVSGLGADARPPVSAELPGAGNLRRGAVEVVPGSPAGSASSAQKD